MRTVKLELEFQAHSDTDEGAIEELLDSFDIKHDSNTAVLVREIATVTGQE